MRRKYDLDETVFETIDSEEKAYWLGFILADGNVYKNEKTYQHLLQIGLSIKDFAHLEKFKKFLKTNLPIKLNKNKTSCILQVQSKKILSDLEKYNIFPRKTFTATYPKIKEELNKHLIRGMIDADGYISLVISDKKYPEYKKPVFSFCGNENIVNSVSLFLDTDLKLSKTKIIKHSKSNVFYYRKSSSPAKGIINFLYKGCSVFLDRKNKIASSIIQWTPNKQKEGNLEF